MKHFLTISPREGSEPRAATSATSGAGSSCHFAAATSTKRFVSVMSDGSTDTTIVEQEVVYVRYVDHGNPVTKLASIQALEHGNAEGVHQGVMKGLATMENQYMYILPHNAHHLNLLMWAGI